MKNSHMANNKKVCFFIEKGKLIAARNQLQATENKITIDLETSVLDQDQVNDLFSLLGELRALISN